MECSHTTLTIVLGILLAITRGSKATSTPLLTYSQVCNMQDGYCYQAFSTATNYLDAWYQCHSHGMHLVMPRTPVQMDFIRDNILGCNTHIGVWFGLKARGSTDTTWWWEDAVQLLDTGYDAWNYGKPTAVKNNKTCGVLEKQRWRNRKCTEDKEYICQSFPRGCTLDAPYLFEDKCYEVITGDFLPSDNLCGNDSLAMPKTQWINQYLHEINSGDVNTWIGLYRPSDNNATFLWQDGNVTTYTNFIDDSVYTNYGNTYYAYMTPSGQWDATSDVYYFTASYVCEYPVRIDCGVLNISDGLAISDKTTEGSVHSVECSTGLVSNIHSMTCADDGSWTRSTDCSTDSGDLCGCNPNEDDSNIVVDVSALSVTRRLQTSAWEDRWSAQLFGYIGALVLIMVYVLCIVIDICNACDKSRRRKNKSK